MAGSPPRPYWLNRMTPKIVLVRRETVHAGRADQAGSDSTGDMQGIWESQNQHYL